MDQAVAIPEGFEIEASAPQIPDGFEIEKPTLGPAPPPKPPLPAGLDGPNVSALDSAAAAAYEAKYGMPAPANLGHGFTEPSKQLERGAKNLVTGNGEGGRVRAASDVIRGGLGIVGGPESLGPMVAAAPIAAPLAVGSGMAAQHYAEKGLTAVGAKPEWAALGGDVAGLATGTVVGGVAGKVREAFRGPAPHVPEGFEVEHATEPAPAAEEKPAAEAAPSPVVPEGFEVEPPVESATPVENPTAGQPTVPETPDTIQMQMAQLRQGKRNVVMFPKDTPVPELPEGTPTHQDSFGNTYAYDAEKIQPATIDAAAASNRLPEILGDAGAGMGAPDKSEIQGTPLTVVSRSMDGTTVQATVTDEARLQDTLAATKKVTPTGGTVAVEPAENEIAARQGAAPPAGEPATEPLAPEQPSAAPQVPEPPPQPETPGALHDFLSDETGTSHVGALLREDWSSTKALVAKRQAALADLERAKATPEETNFGGKVRQWFTGERDVWGARVNQLMDGLRKMVPDPVDQEALSLMRDFKNKPGELQQWLDGTHPSLTGAPDPTVALRNVQRLRPAIERALNPTPQMLAADHLLTSLSDVSLQEGKRLGFLDSSLTPDEYVTHLLHPKDEAEFTPLTERAASKMGGKIGRRFAFAKQRYYPTLLDAVANNVKPRTLNAFDAFTIHGDKFATARATNMLIQALKDSGVGKWGSRAGTAPGGVPMTNIAGAPGVPADWVEIAPHAHPFQNLRAFPGENGEPGLSHQVLFVPKSIEQALRPITDPDYTSRIVGFTKLRMFQAYTKASQLALSLFHPTALNYMGMANMGPAGWAKALRADRDAVGFQHEERDFITHGGTTSVQGKTYEAYKSLQPGTIPTWGDIWKSLPGVHQMDRVANGVTELTFGNLQRKFKVTDYAIHKAGWIAEHPNATPTEQAAAMASIAKEINAVYGGLHWENLGLNRMTVNVLRAIMLAPDWTFSNLVNLKYAAERGTPAGKMARAFWVRTAVGGIAATQALSILYTRQPSKRLTQVFMGHDKDGQEIYQNVFFKGAPGDVVNLINNVGDLGPLMGLAKSVMGKEAPVLRTMTQVGANRDYLGRPLVDQRLSPVAKVVRNGVAVTKGLSPIPFSIQNAYDMIFGPHADRYIKPEVAQTLFAGTPPAHVAPEGMRMTKKGLRSKKKQRPPASLWDQIRTGKPDLLPPGPVR